MSKENLPPASLEHTESRSFYNSLCLRVSVAKMLEKERGTASGFNVNDPLVAASHAIYQAY